MLELAILGILTQQPLHGYELKKQLGDTLGFLWGVSYGSLYPALRRLERAGAIEVVAAADPAAVVAMPTTGSLSGEVVASRLGRRPLAGRRTRKAYRVTPPGRELLAELLSAPAPGGDDDRAFAVKLAFCRHLPAPARLELLERRRAELADRLARARRPRGPAIDRYSRSLVEHRTRSIERDLEWVDELVALERDQPLEEGATA